MSKKILIIKGSARQNGYTNRLCAALEDLFAAEDVTAFDAYRENPAPCIGCNRCENEGKCIYGDLTEFFSDFENADEIFLASPVFNGTFTSPVKNLLDRFQVYYNAFYKNNKTQPINKRRNIRLIVAAGRDGDEAFRYMQSQLRRACTILNLRFAGSFLCPFTDTEDNFEKSLSEINGSLQNEEEHN